MLKRGKLQLEQGLTYLLIIALPESVFIIITAKDESLVALVLEGSLWQVVADFSWCLDSSYLMKTFLWLPEVVFPALLLHCRLSGLLCVLAPHTVCNAHRVHVLLWAVTPNVQGDGWAKKSRYQLLLDDSTGWLCWILVR